MTPEQERGIRELLDSQVDRAGLPEGDAVTILWSMKGVGWGEYHIYIGDDHKVHIANERMSKDSIKKVLGILVDQAELDDPV